MRGKTCIVFVVIVAISAPLIAGCGGGNDNSDSFALCGNGRMDGGERCDDGNTNDHDTCTTVCLQAKCGDGVVQAGVEECDGFDLDLHTCASFGLQDPQEDGLRCTTSCTFDTSGCGPPLPSTPTPPPTEPPTPTPTPTVLGCGNGILESGETCDDCPADCEVLDCVPQAPGPQFQVNFSAPIGQSPSVVSALVGYRSDRVSLPNTATGSRVKMRPAGTSQLVRDLDYAVRVLINAQAGQSVPNGKLFTIDFDVCEGQAAVTPSDFGCQVDSCGSSAGPIEGCTCVVTLPDASLGGP